MDFVEIGRGRRRQANGRQDNESERQREAGTKRIAGLGRGLTHRNRRLVVRHPIGKASFSDPNGITLAALPVPA